MVSKVVGHRQKSLFMESARDIFLYGNYQCNAQVDFAKEGSELRTCGRNCRTQSRSYIQDGKKLLGVGKSKKRGKNGGKGERERKES